MSDVKDKNISFLNSNLVFQFSEGNDSYLAISGAGHPFLSAAVSSLIQCRGQSLLRCTKLCFVD